MTFVCAITTVSERFLTERSFELIVAPALADFEYGAEVGSPRPVTRHLAVLAAVFGACWDDAVRGGHLATFAGLSLIPFCYYSFWFLVWVPEGVRQLGQGIMAIVTIVIVVLSLSPVIVCYWPSGDTSRRSTEQQ